MFEVAWHTVSEVDLARLQKLPRPQLSQVKRLAIDENSLGAVDGFVTVGRGLSVAFRLIFDNDLSSAVPRARRPPLMAE